MFCSKCGAQVSPKGRFCSTCGEAVDPDTGATLLGDEANIEGATIGPASPVPRKTQPSHSSLRTPRTLASSNPLTRADPIGGGRFTPGQIIAERYRVVALAGRGGMGEVYRAEDLTLGQVVALKFLPETLSQDAAALARFHGEVRTARQVSHPNVCRVFDIGEAEGTLFLTMEYVDGEDLASVVRRIGRLSPDKATEIARQICAGLAAAHERGVIHRDLKPANVMLDGAGKIRITDFGLASIAASIQGAEVRAGTPAYMAPEQLAGREVTTKSDIYSLGLILYEILTGKRAFEASTLPELMKQRESGAITNPSTLVRDLDPLIERVILRCLENDPDSRPSSALQVAAALPGGDPLAAALAAGETPSPAMVAASGEIEGTRPRIAIACLAAVVVVTILCTYVGIEESGLRRLHPQYSPEVLSHKARDIIAKLGYPSPPADKGDGFYFDEDFLSYLEKNDKPRPLWDRILSERPPLLVYWYRQSPRAMAPVTFTGPALTPGLVTFNDPPQVFSGMINLRLDPEGRLIYFVAIAPEKEDHPQGPIPADWNSLFLAAGLDLLLLHPTDPVWAPLASADKRAAWEGSWPGTNRPLHVEAAAWHGKPVFFSLIGPWTKPTRLEQAEQTRSEKASQIFGVTLAILLLSGALWLAYRNHVRGRGDRRGALRLASVVFVLNLMIFILRAHFVPTLDTLFLIVLAVSTGLYFSGLLWVLYLALEPYVRRNWPQTIISWSRLLGGRLRDPLIGRDLLFGTLMGMVWVLVFESGYLLDMRVGARPEFASTDFLEGARVTASWWLSNVVGSILGTLIFFFILVILRVIVRNRWLAAALFIVIFTVPHILSSDHPLIETPVWIIVYAIAAIAVVRFGLIVLATATFLANVLLNLPFTLDFSDLYAASSLCVLLSFVALAAWGFYTSLAGQHLWKDELFE